MASAAHEQRRRRRRFGRWLRLVLVVLTFALGRHVRVIELVAIGERRGPAEEARTLYRDLAPPTAETAMPRDLPF